MAQPATLRGFTLDASDGDVLPDVHVVLEGVEGQRSGRVSNADGYYVISDVEPGRHVLRASYIGYLVLVDTLLLAPGEIRSRDLALQPADTELDEVVVEGRRRSTGMATAGLQTVQGRDLERIPLPDVSGDLMGYLQLIPGTVAPGDRGGQLFVRGGTPSQNLVLLDGMVIYQPFHLVGFFSAFPADIVRQADVYAGGFEARYGGRLSSVIDIATRHGDKQQFRGAASVAPFLSALRVEGPIQQGRTSVLASVRESMVERVVPDLWGDALPFRFGDQFVKVHTRLREGSQLSFTALRTHDTGIVDDTEFAKADAEQGDLPTYTERLALPDEEMSWTNAAYGGRFLLLPPDAPVLAELTLSVSHLKNEFGPPADPERTSAVRTVRSSAMITHLLDDWTMRWGVVGQNVTLRYDLGGIFQDVEADDEVQTDFNVFVESAGQLGAWSVQPSLGIHTYAAKGVDVTVEPRLRASWLPGGEDGPYQLSTAWGLYSQNVVGLQDERDAGDIFTAWVTKPFERSMPRALHAILGGQVRPGRGLRLGLEGYYKALRNLSIPSWSAFPRFTTTLQPADGRVWGVDLRAEVERGPLYLYAGYGLSSVVYRAQQASFGVWYGTEQERFHPPHDQRHQFNLLGSVELGRFQVNVRWQYGSGRPYTRPYGFDDWILFETLVDVRREPGDYRVLFERPYQGRLPAYHRLDVTVERTIPLGRARLTVQVGAVNTYDRRNLFYFDLWTLRRVDQIALTPSFGIKLETR